MIEVKTEIISAIKRSLREFTKEEIKFLVERPENESFGDYSSNIALTLFASEKRKVTSKKLRTPFELAQEIAKRLNSPKLKLANIDKVEAVKPGFINFWISKNYLINQLSSGFTPSPKATEGHGAGRRIMVEFTDPNPFKEFHIGHLYSNTVGESISRLLEVLGANVKRANYQGDVGMHVAKAIYGIFQLCHAEFISASQILENKIRKLGQDDSLNKRIKFLGEAYASGAKAYEEDEKAKKEIEELNKKIYDKDPAITTLYEKGRQWSLEYFEEIYKRLGTKFDFYYFESEVGKDGLKLVREYLKKGVFEESQGAVIFPGGKHGLHARVFINSLGLPTYEAKDLGLAPTKYKDFPYDLSIIITATEQSDYFKVVLKALSLIDPELAKKTKHISHGVVRLPMGKMSSRTGTIITGEWLLDEAKRRIQKTYKEMDQETAEKVAVGAVKYSLLKSGIGKDLSFDFDESISLEGNSGPYLQYTFARTQSVLNKVKSQKSKVKNAIQNSKIGENIGLTTYNFKPEELSVFRALHRFPEVVGEAAGNFAPNILCNYLFDLSQKFNLFYQKVPIIKQTKSLGSNVNNLGGSKLKQQQQREFRLALTTAVGQIIKNGLDLLGIVAPERM